MIVAVDVCYHKTYAVAAAIAFERWTQDQPSQTTSVVVDEVSPYEPGHFYRRELPCILAVLKRLQQDQVDIETVIVDGYVWLGVKRPGLGAHLFESLNSQSRSHPIAVIGVAKTNFFVEPNTAHDEVARVIPVLRGCSVKALYVSAAGVAADVAADHIRSMHGPYRTPTLLNAVDRLSRVADVPLIGAVASAQT